MATLRWRKAAPTKREWAVGGGWVVCWTDPMKKRRLRQFQDKREAEKFLKQVKSGKASPALGKHFTVQDACERYLRVCEQRYRDGDRMSRSWLANLRSIVDNHIVPKIGKVKLADLTPLMVDEFIIQLRRDPKRPRGPHVLQGVVGVLRNAITEAQRLQLINRNVIKDVPPRRPPIKKAEISIPDKQQIAQLLSVEASPRDKMCVELALFTGMRAGELAALTWDCIDFDKNLIEVKRSVTPQGEFKSPKTRKGFRKIPISQHMTAALRAYRLVSGSRSFVINGKRKRRAGSDR